MIEFVRTYKKYNMTIYEVKYKSRIRTYFDKAPKNILLFMDNAKSTKQIDQFHGEEIIYKEV